MQTTHTDNTEYKELSDANYIVRNAITAVKAMEHGMARRDAYFQQLVDVIHKPMTKLHSVRFND